jgi:hypothetical protein
LHVHCDHLAPQRKSRGGFVIPCCHSRSLGGSSTAGRRCEQDDHVQMAHDHAIPLFPTKIALKIRGVLRENAVKTWPVTLEQGASSS